MKGTSQKSKIKTTQVSVLLRKRNTKFVFFDIFFRMSLKNRLDQVDCLPD